MAQAPSSNPNFAFRSNIPGPETDPGSGGLSRFSTLRRFGRVGVMRQRACRLCTGGRGGSVVLVVVARRKGGRDANVISHFAFVDRDAAGARAVRRFPRASR